MRQGDLVIHEYCPQYGYGIVLNVDIDKSDLKHRFETPWVYTVYWTNNTIKNHEMGILRRISIYEIR